MKALTVDDDPIALSLTEKILRYSGFQDVATAQDAVEASQIIASASPPFDCILLDFMMPKIEGDYLCQWVRQLPQYAHTPILMVTAAGSKSHIDRAFSAGASDYITKPFEIADIEIRLSRVRKEISSRRGTEGVAYTCAEEWKSKADRVDFCKPMLIGDTAKELKISALEQYVSQLAKKGQRDVYAFAFALEDAAKLHFACSKSDFLLILEATARAISTNLPRSECFFSYVGCGGFAGVVEGHDADLPAWRKRAGEIKQNLSHLLVPGRSGHYLKVIPHACDPIPLSTLAPEKSLDVLYRAVVEAEQKTPAARMVA